MPSSRDDVPMEVDDEENHGGASTSAPPRRAISVGPNNRWKIAPFVYMLFAILEDGDKGEEIFGCIIWWEGGGEHGIWIPDIYVFCLHVLPKFFPGQKKWGSFHKQLSNYGFEKRDWDSTQGKFVHSKGMFRPGRKDLLVDVRFQRKTVAPPQNAVQEQPTPGPSTTPNNVPQPVVPGNDCAPIDMLRREIENLKNEFQEVQNELQEENRKLNERVSKLEEAQAHNHPVISNRVDQGKGRALSMDGEQDPAPSGDSSSHSRLPSGPAAPPFGNGYRMVGPSRFGGIGHVLPPESQTVHGRNPPDPASLSSHPPHPHQQSRGPTAHVGFPVVYTDAHPKQREPPSGCNPPNESASPSAQGPANSGTSTTPNNVLQVVSIENVCHWVIGLLLGFISLQNTNDELREDNRLLKQGQDDLRAEIAKLKEGQNELQAENDRLKMLSGSWIYQACDPGMGDQLGGGEDENRLWEEIMNQDAMSPENGSLRSTVQPGLTAAPFDNNDRMPEASGSGGIQHDLPSGSLDVTNFEGILPDVPCQNNTIGPALTSRQLTCFHPLASASSARVSPSPNAHPTNEGSAPDPTSSRGPAGSDEQLPRINDPREPLNAQNVPETVQSPRSVPAFNDRRAFGPQLDKSLALVRLPLPPRGVGRINVGPSARSSQAEPTGPPTQWDVTPDDVLPPGGFPFL